MDQKSIFINLMQAFMKLRSGESEPGFDFYTGRNGKQCLVNSEINLHIRNLCQILYANLNNAELEIDEARYGYVVNKAIVDLYTEKKFSDNPEDAKNNIKLLKKDIEAKLGYVRKHNTHHFAASTIGLEFGTPIIIGPVTIMDRDTWIDSVDYRDDVKDTYWGEKKDNYEWKKILREALKNKESKLSGLALEVYSVIEKSKAIVSVDVKGMESRLSERFAHIIAKTSLDMISLCMGVNHAFVQQVLYDERLKPGMTYSLSSYDGFLDHRGFSLAEHCIPIFTSYEHKQKGIDVLRKYQPQFSYILSNLEENKDNTHPILAMKWMFALNWYAEGMRESNDAIALAKLASCLDTLSSSGKLAGIKTLICNILNLTDETKIFDINGVQPLTLHAFVKRFYDDGRSRILHGTLESMLESFEIDRKRLANLARDVLLECANRLHTYDGEDSEIAFRSI